uniref:Putative reverse transcriptase n=1 Tax=Ixodes ricinus TaxID=34613 RepID=A0A6B0V6N5_IXORI
MNCSVFYQNVRGLRTKPAIFFNNVVLAYYDIISLSETWLNSSFASLDYFPPEYTVFRRDRDYEKLSVKFGGGVLTAVKKHLRANRRFDLEFEWESVWIEIPLRDNSSLLIGTFYFPPNVDGSKFSDQLDMLGDKLDVDQHRILILGDFNIPEINWHLVHPSLFAHSASFKANALFSFVNLLGFTQTNGLHNSAGHVLDLALANFPIDSLMSVSDPLVLPDVWHVPFSVSFMISQFKCM